MARSDNFSSCGSMEMEYCATTAGTLSKAMEYMFAAEQSGSDPDEFEKDMYLGENFEG